MPRKIIHCDADCFFAAIEMRDNPQWRDRAIAVGGSPAHRGVIATCNYPARQFGVRSAMASAKALRLCPGLTIVPHRMSVYREVSAQLNAIFCEFTDTLEPLSLDEAFLDVTDTVHCNGSATRIAEAIRARVQQRLGISVSAGVASNKFLAKVASDWRKPNGLFVIAPHEVEAFVADLPVVRIPGVGRVTAERLYRMGVTKCAHLQAFTQQDLHRYFGAFGERLYQYSRGVDKRPVQVQRRRKSLSVERTFPRDLGAGLEVDAPLSELLVRLERRIQQLDDGYRIIKAFVKIKFSDFTHTTVERLARKCDKSLYRELIKEAFTRHSGAVRLLGVGVRITDVADDACPQLALFKASGGESG